MMKNQIRGLYTAILSLSMIASMAALHAGSGSAPDQPVLVRPADNAAATKLSPVLETSVSDPESDILTVTFFGRPLSPDEKKPFTIITIPDTQYYTSALYGGATWMFQEQVRWIVNNAVELNIVFVSHTGDVVQRGDADFGEWYNAWSALGMLEDSGIPYSVSVGDNDQTPEGEADGTTTWYNSFYGPDHFEGVSWYGGHFGSKGDDHFVLFSASGRDFISISLEYDESPDADVLAWADSLLLAYPDRWGIICSHHILGTGNPAVFGWQGNRIYQQLWDNPNMFLMVSGHIPGEGRRSVDMGDRWIHALMADYQARANGGDGWMRLITFYPVSGRMNVRTYSPVLDRYETDADSSSQFTLPVVLEPAVEWQVIGTVEGVLSGTAASIQWPGLEPLTGYEWYVEVDDGSSVTSGERWSFTTGGGEDEDIPSLSFDIISGNPGRDGAVFAVTIPVPSNIRLTIHDAPGRLVGIAASGEYPAGRYEFSWTGISSGVYFARLQACGETVSKKIVLIR